MNNIDVIFYINLAKRTDRNHHFLEEIVKLCDDTTKVHRIDAVYNKIGILGCVKSHIKALEEFEKNPEWETCIIFEDDFTFRNNNKEENNAHLAKCFQEKWDVIILAHNNLKFEDTNYSEIKKVTFAQTTSGYCVQKKFVPVLKNNFKESERDLEATGEANYWNALDVHWSKIQSPHNWFTTIPSIGHQYSNYSDIEKQFAVRNC